MPNARIESCPSCRTERIARRVAGVVVQGVSHDVLRCSHGRCLLVWCLPADRPRTAPAETRDAA